MWIQTADDKSSPLISSEVKSCMFILNKSIIRMFLTCCLLKSSSISHNIAFSSEKWSIEQALLFSFLVNYSSKKWFAFSHRLSVPFSFRRLYREHLAFISRHSPLLQTPVYDHYPGWDSWWSNSDDFMDRLNAASPSSSPFRPPSAVRQTARLWGLHECCYR